MIGDDIELSVLSIAGGTIRVGIQAPRDVPILRTEICEKPKSSGRFPRAMIASARQRSKTTPQRRRVKLGLPPPDGGFAGSVEEGKQQTRAATAGIARATPDNFPIRLALSCDERLVRELFAPVPSAPSRCSSIAIRGRCWPSAASWWGPSRPRTPSSTRSWPLTATSSHHGSRLSCVRGCTRSRAIGACRSSARVRSICRSTGSSRPPTIRPPTWPCGTIYARYWATSDGFPKSSERHWC